MNIYDFEDYRSFLNAWLEEKKIRTVRGLAMRLEVSPSLVTKIRKRQRSIDIDQAQHWAWALRLDTYEADYFDALVRAEEAPTQRLREEAKREADSARKWEFARRERGMLQVHSEWYVGVVWQFALTPGFRADPEWVAPRLLPPVSVEQAQHALDVLFAVGMLTRDGDRVVASTQAATTGRRLEKGELSRAVGRVHVSFLEHTLECLHTMPPSMRHAAVVTAALPETRFGEVERLLQKLQVEATATLDGVEPDRVYQLGVYLMPRSANTKS